MIYETTDAATLEVMKAFWSAVSIVKEQASVTEADALMHMKRSVIDRVKAAKPTELCDYTPDGRSATWRVRLQIWRGMTHESLELVADTDPGPSLTSPGSTLIQGLPGVAAWAWSMIEQCHPGETISDLSLASITGKLRTLRVALSNQGGEVVWRLRYVINPPDVAPLPVHDGSRSLKGIGNQRSRAAMYLAHVRVSQEAGTGRREK